MLLLIKIRDYIMRLFKSRRLSKLDAHGLIVQGLLNQIMHYHESGQEAPEELKKQLHLECHTLNCIDSEDK